MRECVVLINNKKYTIEFDYDTKEQLVTGIRNSKGKLLSETKTKAIIREFFKDYSVVGKGINYEIHKRPGYPLKRYYDLDGIENYRLFLRANDFASLPVLELKVKEMQPQGKLKLGARIITTLLLLGTITLANSERISQSGYIDEFQSLISDIDDDFSSDSLRKAIENNPNIDDNYKNLLLSSDFIDNLVNTNLSRAQKAEIYYNLSTLDFKPFSLEFSEQNEINNYQNGVLTEAYVDKTYEENVIRFKDLTTEVISTNLPHEFTHVVQNDSKYLYLKEAVSEIATSEFWNRPIRTYYNSIKRIKTLMEIIGPEPVWDECFAKNSSFEEEVKSLLSEDDANKFLNLLKNPPYTSEFDKEKNEYINDTKIDKYLSLMYEAKYGEKMSKNQIINDIYLSSSSDQTTRYYFNVDKIREEVNKENIYDKFTKQFEKIIEKSLNK